MSQRVIRGFVVIAAALALAVSARADDAPELVIGMASVKNASQGRNAREQQQGLQLWIDDINARGGLVGRKVKLRYRDEAPDAEALASVYEKLIVEDHVELLVGPNAADLAPVAATVAEKNQVPLLVPSVTTTAFWEHGYQYIFGLSTPPDTLADPLLKFARHKDLRRLALIYPDSGFARDVVMGVKSQLVALGMSVIFESTYPGDQPDFASTVEKLKRRHPDVILVGSHLPAAVAFMRQAKEQKMSAKVIAFSGGAELIDFSKQLGADAEGAIGLSQWESGLKSASVAEFVRRYKAKFGYEPDVFAASGYSAGQVWEGAVKKAAGTDRARLRKALLELDTALVLGRYKVDGRGRQIGKMSCAVQWNHGTRDVILPEDVASAPVVYPFRDWSKR